MAEIEFIAAAGGYSSYFHDESRLNGSADYIVFPEDTIQAAAAFRRASREKIPLTIQGSRTGLVGGAVPSGGLILSAEKMNRALGFSDGDVPVLRVQAGMSLDAIAGFLLRGLPPDDWDAETAALFRKQARNMRFPPNPTESTASIGGAFACGARGPNALLWGGVGEQVQGLVWLTPEGGIWRVERGQYCFDETGCPLPDGRRLSCNAGLSDGGCRFLHPRPGLDLVDFLAGSEGLLGFAAELSLYIRKSPVAVWGAIYFFKREQTAFDFIESLRRERERVLKREQTAFDSAESLRRERERVFRRGYLSTLEYYDSASLELVRRMAPQTAVLRRIPLINPGMEAAVQVELEGDDSEALEAALTEQLELFLDAGGAEEDTWAAGSPAELEKFHLLRHAVPELINAELDKIRLTAPNMYRIPVDFAVPPELAGAYHKTCRRDIEAERLRGFIFGCAAEGQFHISLLPESPDALYRCRALADRWAAQVVQDRGSLTAGNGVGRLKRDMVYRGLSPERLEQIHSILRTFDEHSLLGGFEPRGEGDYADWGMR
jgi:D-lactate dehydrogenase (cytochrome)